MRNEILMKVKMIEPQLTAVQKKIARFILENSKAVVSMTVSDLAIQSDASEPSVFRFLKQIDYESYQLFRIDLAQSLATKNTATIYGDIEEADTTTMIKKKVVASTISAITELEDVLVDDSVEAGATSIITARRIIIVGIGASVSIASDLFHKLLQL
ncbi:MurR/RpiR family transcriptional regulator, partial [Brochothrix thermosphacta]|uniref:MurR/RpiR family transcriptional regulator n=1 Tax=Brochothrix thermosphacta TaxID=2756 RepID=UPI000EDC1683